MSTLTENYGFIKPEKTDPADITATNGNWDNIDKIIGDTVVASRCYSSLKDIGITEFPTTMNIVANKIPKHSMLVLDTRLMDAKDEGTPDEKKYVISDWGLLDSTGERPIYGTVYIAKGEYPTRLSMIFVESHAQISNDKFRTYTGVYNGETVIWSNLTNHAPQYTYGTSDLTAGTSRLETGKLYLVYE